MNLPTSGAQGVYVGSDGGGTEQSRLQPQRGLELIDQLRGEFESVASEIKVYRNIREDIQRKAEEQLSEMSNFENALRQMQQKHEIMKEQYEAEIRGLKRQLMGGNSFPAATGAVGREEPLNALPGLGARGANPTAAPGQLGGGFQGSQGSNAAAPKRMRADVTPATTTTTTGSVIGMGNMGSVIGKPINFPVQATRSDGATRGSPKEDTTDVQGGDNFGQGISAAGGLMTNNQEVSASNNSENDYVVYQGKTSGGNLLNMNVKLQNSFAHDSVVCCVRYSWDGRYLATGSNKCAQMFEAVTGAKVATFARDDNVVGQDDSVQTDSYIRAVCFSPDQKWLITGSEDRLVKVWDVRSRTVKHRLAGHETDIYSVDASSDGKFIASGSGDKKAKLWDLLSGKLLHTLDGGDLAPADGITSVSISPTSHHVAAGSLDKIVRVWDVEHGKLVRSFEGHKDSVYSVAFSPDCRMLLSGSLDKTLKLWDLAASNASSQCRISFTGHKDFVLSVAFSPTGRWLISGSKDRTVQFWDPRQPNMCLMLQGHKNSVISIAHSPKGLALATGSGDSRARTWVYTN